MEVPFDFGQVEGKTLGDFLPEGQFECVCTEVKKGRSAKKGTPYWELHWECIDGGDEYEGGKAIERKYLTEGTAPYVKGWAESVMNVQLTSMAVNEQMFVGRKALVKVVEYTEMYQGEERDRKDVDSYYSENYGHHNKQADGSQGADTTSWKDLPQDQGAGGGGGNGGYSNGGGNGQSSEEMDDLPF